MKLIVIAVLAGLTVFAATVSCPEHLGSSCWPNGKFSQTGAKGYTCTCRDQIWVK